MSHIWTFSASSIPYLQRCLAAASHQKNDNEWYQTFGPKIAIFKISDPETPATEAIEVAPSPEEKENEESVAYINFFDNIEQEIRLDFISGECSTNPDLLTEMAHRLSTNTVEKLFNHIFTIKDTKNSFITSCFTTFLPVYIKHQYSWLCIDLLTKTNEIHPELFLKLLQTLLEDTQVSAQVLNDYTNTLNEQKLAKFMQDLTTMDLTSGSFVHNILTIYTVYKDCKKTDRIQNFIRTNLLKHSEHCKADRNYGRLFLAYLQAEKSLERTVNVRQLEDCLEHHTSPFKRPCVMMLESFVGN